MLVIGLKVNTPEEALKKRIKKRGTYGFLSYTDNLTTVMLNA